MHDRGRKLALLSLAGVFVLGLLALAWATGAESSGAQQDETQNCPLPDKWAISVWSGDDGTGAEQAFATCGPQAVQAAYYIDPQTQSWLRWFAGRPEISNLSALNDMQGVLARAAAGAPPPTAAPHGRIAFWSDRDGNAEIYAMNADGTGQTNLTNNAAWDGEPAWSPDGSKIAFGSDRDGNHEIYVMNADGTNVIRLTNDPEWDFSPAWSPDGSKIAFDSNRDGDYEIYVMNADGTGQTRLTNNPDYDSWPSWSPDGSHIAFHSLRDDNTEIYVMNADGTGQTNLTNNAAGDGLPSWSAFGGQQGSMYNCPQASKWAISVWSGDDGTDPDQAFATCGPQAVEAAYYIDPETQSWLRWFAGRPEISNLQTLNDMQGVIALGGAEAAATPTLTPTPSPTPTGPIVFSGSIVSGPTKEDPLWGPCGWWWWVMEVELDELVKMEQEGCFFECLYAYVPGETVEVLYFAAEAPGVAVGDHVEVSGQESMFACGCDCCCDGLGFVVDPEIAGDYIRPA